MFAFSINRTLLIVASPADLVSSVFLFQKWCFLIFSASSTIQSFILYVVREPLLFRDCKKKKKKKKKEGYAIQYQAPKA